MEEFPSYLWRMWSLAQISNIKTTPCKLAERHPVLVAGWVVNKKVLPYTGGHPPDAGVKM